MDKGMDNIFLIVESLSISVFGLRFKVMLTGFPTL